MARESSDQDLPKVPWDRVKELVEAERDLRTRKIVQGGISMEQTENIRGRIAALTWVLSMPRMEKALRDGLDGKISVDVR